MTTELLSYAIIMAGLVVLGFNAAVAIHAAQIVSSSVQAWRVFIIGKSALTVYVITSLYEHHHHPQGWLLSLAGFAMLVTLSSLYLLDRGYRRAHPRTRKGLHA